MNHTFTCCNQLFRPVPTSITRAGVEHATRSAFQLAIASRLQLQSKRPDKCLFNHCKVLIRKIDMAFRVIHYFLQSTWRPKINSCNDYTSPISSSDLSSWTRPHVTKNWFPQFKDRNIFCLNLWFIQLSTTKDAHIFRDFSSNLAMHLMVPTPAWLLKLWLSMHRAAESLITLHPPRLPMNSGPQERS